MRRRVVERGRAEDTCLSVRVERRGRAWPCLTSAGSARWVTDVSLPRACRWPWKHSPYWGLQVSADERETSQAPTLQTGKVTDSGKAEAQQAFPMTLPSHQSAAREAFTSTARLQGEGSPEILCWKPDSVSTCLGRSRVWVNKGSGDRPRPVSEREFWTSCCCIVFFCRKMCSDFY